MQQQANVHINIQDTLWDSNKSVPGVVKQAKTISDNTQRNKYMKKEEGQPFLVIKVLPGSRELCRNSRGSLLPI